MHPHPPLLTFTIVRGAEPVLINSYTAVTAPPSAFIVPKSCVVPLNDISALSLAMPVAMPAIATIISNNIFFIVD